MINLLYMEITKRKSIHERLKVFDFLAKDSDFIEVTEWTNGEGYDIHINEYTIALTEGQLDAINYLVSSLRYASN